MKNVNAVPKSMTDKISSTQLWSAWKLHLTRMVDKN